MTKKKASKLKLKAEPRRTEHVHVRFLKAERGELQLLADLWTGGDLSKWVRYASLNYKPGLEETERE